MKYATIEIFGDKIEISDSGILALKYEIITIFRHEIRNFQFGTQINELIFVKYFIIAALKYELIARFQNEYELTPPSQMRP